MCGLGSRVEVQGSWVEGLGFSVQSLRSRVWRLGWMGYRSWVQSHGLGYKCSEYVSDESKQGDREVVRLGGEAERRREGGREEKEGRNCCKMACVMLHVVLA
eukprot:1241131-Rhodomonas_salina.3